MFWIWLWAVILVVGAVVLALTESQFRLVEAWIAAAVLDTTMVGQARPLGTAVAFPLGGASVGYTITAGCTAALLISPFGVLAGGLIASRRTSVRRALGTLAAIGVSLFIVNQLRLLVVALSMRWWGFHRGYEISHVLLGTVVSTLGVVGALIIFLRLLVGRRVAGELGG